jgi:dephospho-CoA kinase
VNSTVRPAGTQRVAVVALTGGIASGKGAVSERLERRGAAILDADRIARDLVRPGEPALAEIADAFGAQALLPSGELDRARMRERVFADIAARRRLESILHPRVRAALRVGVTECAAAYCVLVIPLLTEVRGDYDFVDRVLVVDVSPAVQQQRLMLRDGCSKQAAAAMIAAQAPRAARLAIADDVVDNDGDWSMLDAPIARLHEVYLRIATRKTGFQPALE